MHYFLGRSSIGMGCRMLAVQGVQIAHVQVTGVSQSRVRQKAPQKTKAPAQCTGLSSAGRKSCGACWAGIKNPASGHPS